MGFESYSSTEIKDTLFLDLTDRNIHAGFKKPESIIIYDVSLQV